MADTHFTKGAEVEVSSDDDGFRGSWFAATIVEPPTQTKSTTQRSTKRNAIQKVLIEYKTLKADEAGTKPLRETVNVVQVRPPPPGESDRVFSFSEEVDAYYNDGWWEGVVTGVLENSRYSVFFRPTREQIEFGKKDLRLHREWVNGNWVPPMEELEEKKMGPVAESKTSKVRAQDKFGNGMPVEVSSDEDGFQGAWFAATVVRAIDKDKFLVEYQNLRTDDDKEFLREEVDIQHIRPSPPETLVVDRFSLLEEVDAIYTDGWWVGVISKVLDGSKYVVYFRGTNEEMEFDHSDLRLHQDWMDGKWRKPSRALKL